MSVESNKQAAKRYYDEALNEGVLDALDEIAVPGFVEHYPFPGQRDGLAGLKDRVTMIRSGLAAHFTVDDVIAEGDKVVVVWTNEGSMVSEFLGMPANGKRFKIPGIDVWRLQDGKLAEHWHVVDQLGHAQQIGLIPANA